MRRVGCIWMLATHSPDLTRLQAVERFEYGYHQWAKIVDIVAWRYHDHDADREPGQILLVFNTLVDCQQGVELTFSRAQQRAILDARPPGFSNRRDFVARKLHA